VKVVETKNAPKPAGHYSQGVVQGGFVFVAGQLPWDPERPGVFPPSIEEQTERALRNVEAILVAAGSGLDRLVSVTIYVSDLSLWGRVNAKYAEILGPHKPARAVVPTAPLHHGALLEISAIAAVPSSRKRGNKPRR
jgi:2-iminobutanoate/2-iminopropanoate deaminase